MRFLPRISWVRPRSHAVGSTESGSAGRQHGVVHSIRGRLRVHLASWTGEGGDEIVRQVRQFPGVTHASASRLTGNVLILFNPCQTEPEHLVSLLLALPFEEKPRPAPSRKAEEREATAFVAVAKPVEVESHTNAGRYVTGTKRLLYRILGWASVVMAIIGAILPGIPTAPFVILAGYFFIRSSPEAHQWLRESRWFGPILRDWEEHHGISRSTRNAAVGLILMAALICTFLGLPLPLLLSIHAMQLIGLIIVLRLHVVDRPAIDPAPVG